MPPHRRAGEPGRADRLRPRGSEPKMASLDPDGLPVCQRVGHLSACRDDQAMERRLRDLHPRGAFALVESFKILESHGLVLVDREDDHVRGRRSHSGGCERREGRLEADPPASSAAGHYARSLSLRWISIFSASILLSSASSSSFCASSLRGSAGMLYQQKPLPKPPPDPCLKPLARVIPLP